MIRLFLALLAIASSLEGLAADAHGALSTYRLSSGDVISIYVVGEDDLKREKVRLSDAGTIQYPVLGEVRVLGLTIGGLEQRITSGLKGRYLVDPKVVVNIEEYRPFFINGEVGKPGGYPYVPGLTLLKAIAIAGGFKDRASKTRMWVIREGDTAQKRERIDLNSAIHPGDIITIEESFF